MSSIFCLNLFAGQEDKGPSTKPPKKPPVAEANEKPIVKKDLNKILADIKVFFAKHSNFEALFEEEIEGDLLDSYINRGTVLIARPGTVLRVFYKGDKPEKGSLLQGKQRLSYNPGLKKIKVKDYTRAPNQLALLRAGTNGDFQALVKYYDIVGFQRAEIKGVKQCRIVLSYRKGPLPYSRIHVIYTDGRVFFDEIRYESDGKRVERYSKFKTFNKIPKKRFDLEMFKGRDKDVEMVVDKSTDD